MFNFLPECKSSPDSNHPCYYTFCKHVVSDVQIVINGFNLTVDGNMQITMRHVVLVLVTDKSKKYKTKDCSLNFRVHMFMKGALKIQ